METMTEKLAGRSAVQRTEIGPIFHDIAHEIFGVVEEDVASGEVPVPAQHQMTIRGMAAALMPLTEDVSARAAEFCGKKISGAPWEGWFKEDRHLTVGFWTQVKEGMDSGVVAPIRLMQLIGIAESDTPHSAGIELIRAYANNSNILFNLEDLTDRFMQPHFLRMLHQLAYAPNGYLLAASGSLSSPAMMNCFIDDGLDGVFDMSGGKVQGFSQDFLERKHNAMQRNNRNARLWGGDAHVSGGCPVRHATFKEIGPQAAEYLTFMNDEPRPNNEGESAITRGARLVAFALRHAAANREADS